MAHKIDIKIKKNNKVLKVNKIENELKKMDKNTADLVNNLYTNIGAWMDLDDEK